jgi:hypothetical protein
LFGAAGLQGTLAVSASLDSQFRFMAGIYLAIAALAWWVAPRVATATAIVRIVCAAIFIGGLGRLAAIAQYGLPETPMIAGLVLELAAPLLIIWQNSVARDADRAAR